jgi:hypothetical protein
MRKRVGTGTSTNQPLPSVDYIGLHVISNEMGHNNERRVRNTLQGTIPAFVRG